PALPPGFEAVVNRALEKNLALRYPSATELAQALASFASPQTRDLAQRRVAATPGMLPGAAHPVLEPPAANTLDAAAGRAAIGLSGGRSHALTVAGSLVALAAMGVAIGMRGPRSDGGALDPEDERARVHHPTAAAVRPNPDMSPVVVDPSVAPPPVTAPPAGR